jgi:hypothetical protein
MEPLTERQLKAIYSYGRAALMSQEEVNRYCGGFFGRAPEELTKREASEFIDLVKPPR